MARGNSGFVGQKSIGVAVAVLVLLSAIGCSVIKVTDELVTEIIPKTTPFRESKSKFDEKGPLVTEFFEILNELTPVTPNYDEMQADGQPAVAADGNGKANSTIPNKDGARSGRIVPPADTDETDSYHKWQRNQALYEVQKKILFYTGHTGRFGQYFPNVSHQLPAAVNFSLPEVPHHGTAYKLEAIPPICPIKNEENLTISFNISDPKASSKDMILSVISAELKLYKIPVQLSVSSENGEDDPAQSQWRETFEKSQVQASDRVIRTKAEEQRMLHITVHKIRNKSKIYETKKIDAKMVPAMFEGLTNWSIAKAINVWGNDTKKALNLVITVEDENGNKVPTRDVFQMRCGNHFYKPLPVPMNAHYTPSENSHTAWLNLATEERPAREEAYNGAVDTVNRISGDTYDADGAQQQVALDLDKKK